MLRFSNTKAELIFALVALVFAARQGVADTTDRNVVTAPGSSSGATKRTWVVLAGVDKYQDSAIGNLRFCVADVERMENVLVRRCGYDPRRILALRNPTRLQLQEKTREWLVKAARGDTVIVFFSGHGFLDAESQGFLAPADCNRGNLGLTAFRLDNLRDLLRQCRATQKVLILDCCHAGAAKGERADASGEELAASLGTAEGLITLASCRKQQQSIEWPERGHGLFTYHLSEGLAGAADRDRDGVVDSDEVFRYVSEQVPRRNPKQTPVRLGEGDVPIFTLATYGRPSTMPGRPTEPHDYATWTQVDGAWKPWAIASIACLAVTLAGFLWRRRAGNRRLASPAPPSLSAQLDLIRRRLHAGKYSRKGQDAWELRDVDLLLDRLQQRLRTARVDEALSDSASQGTEQLVARAEAFLNARDSVEGSRALAALKSHLTLMESRLATANE